MVWQGSVKFFSVVALHASSRNTSRLSPQLMDPIVNHPAIASLGIDCRPRRKLKERHMELFREQGENTQKHPSALLLNELGLMACRTGAVPRKELLETFAAATYIDAKFPQIRRVADVAAGHGLLSWFLLALDPTRSAICIDRRMPGSADIIADAMLELYPDLESKWCYVEADLSSIESHPSTLLASVHACGSLSDKLIEMAIDGNAPVAVVPCCHTIKAKKGYQPHPLIQMDATDVELMAQRLMKEDADTTLGDVVDLVRRDTLDRAGYDVEEVMLPEMFTKRNRLIFGEKMESPPGSSTQENPLTPPKIQVVVNVNPGKQMPTVKVPLSDDARSRAVCDAASGRRQASKRLIASIPRHFSPTYDISVWLPNNEPLTAARFHALQVLGNDSCLNVQIQYEEQSNSPSTAIGAVHCTVSRLREPHLDKATGNVSQSYRFQYANKQSLGEESNTPTPLSKDLAKAIHNDIRQRIPNELGLLVR